MARLSLCMIVRDEALFLPGCLASVRGVVDQLVVVDTGSTDDTAAIARDAGATVVRFDWVDDFAAARNAALPHVTGEFVLVLDADERLAPGAAAAIRAALARPGWMLGLLPLHDAARVDVPAEEVLDGRARLGNPAYLPRLLRRTPDLQWTGIVHETVAPWLARHGARTRTVEAPIVHLGAVPEVRAAKGKDARNLRLLEVLCASDPDEPTPWAHLAAERSRSGDPAGAIEAVERGWAALGRAMTRPGLKPAVVPLASQRAQVQLAKGDPAGARATITTARGWSAEHPNYAWFAAHAALALGELDAAEREARAALAQRGSVFTQEVLDGVLGWATEELLGQILLRAGRPAEALQAWQRASTERPDRVEAALGQVEALLDLGDAAAALKAVEPWVARGAGDAWTLAGEAAAALGDLDGAVALGARGKDGPWLDPRRLRRQRALHAQLSFRKGAPRPGEGPWGTLGALVARQPLTGAAPVPPDVIALATRVLVERGGEQLGALFEPRAESLVPGIRAAVERALGELGLAWTDDDEPDFVFVGGAGRSGTTLFRAMLSAHPRLWCGPERKLVPVLGDLTGQWKRNPDLAEAGVDGAALDGAAKAWLTAFLRAGAPAGKRIAEKTPHNLLHLGWLAGLFPKARFVHVLRDGRAVAESLVRQRWVDPDTGEVIPYCRDLEQAALYWATVVNTVRKQAAAAPDRVLELRYEDLVADPRASMERVLAFLGEPWDDAVLHHESSGRVALSSRESSTAAVSRATTTAHLGRWREALSARDVEVIERAAGPVLAITGYGADF
jgi:tetratricopeptide (TPR) repeat protein